MPPYDNSPQRRMVIYFNGIQMTVLMRDIDTFTYHDILHYNQQMKYDNWATSPGNTVHDSMVEHVEFRKHQAAEVQQLKGIPAKTDSISNPMPRKSRSGRIYTSNSLIHTLNELNALDGLNRFKNELLQIIQAILIHKMRSAEGLKNKPLNLNCVFVGNKGPDETMVMGIYGRMLKALGVFPFLDILEMDIIGLIEGRGRDRETRSLQKIEDLFGKTYLWRILFIRSDDINKVCSFLKNNQTINVLMKRIGYWTRQRESQSYGVFPFIPFIAIITGNEISVGKCLNSIPELLSLFPTYVHLDDYSPQELLGIFTRICEEEEYKIEPTALKLIRRTIEFEYNKPKDDNFEGRQYVENLFENIKKKQSKRLLERGRQPTLTDLTTILPDDV